MNREQLHARFQGIYEGLNPEQRKAVDHIEGPVLVIAGPGTGKTQILSARIGKILLETDALPENILCLTYTDAGRVAMRKRLTEMIGADAYRVGIHTFHSYCNQIIQENTSQFNRSSLDPVEDLERIEVIREIIDEFPEGHPLKRYRGDAYFEIGRLRNLYETMKKESWTPEFISERIDEYLRALPETDGYFAKRRVVTKKQVFEKGDPRTDKIAEETRRMDMVRAAAQSLPHYERKMMERSRYDFDDMIQWVLRALAENENMLADQRERYQYFLVDEFQDTSGSQNQLIDLLAGDDPHANLFVVGDDDQSIYRFQGANIENIMAYRQKYRQHLLQVVLKQNYRSTQHILDAARSVIENNNSRLAARDVNLQKELLASHPERLAATVTPLIRSFENPFQELAGICEEIRGLIREQGVLPQHIAVIFPVNRIGLEMMRFMQSRGVPYYTKNAEDLFRLPSSRKVIQILRYVSMEQKVPYSGDALLFEILHYSHFGVEPGDIAMASARAHGLRVDRRDPKLSLRQYLREQLHTVNPELFKESLSPALRKTQALLETWIGMAFDGTVTELTEHIMHEGGFVQQALTASDRMWELEVLRALMDFIKNDMHRHPDQGLSGLTDTLDLMDEQGVGLPLIRTYGAENGVNLLTAHGSKGLEFRHVYILQAVSNLWEKSRGFSQAFRLPPTIWENTENEETKAQDEEERRRLFFVAMTRAEEHLCISWTRQDDKRKSLEPTRFIAEIKERYPVQEINTRLAPETMELYLALYLERDTRPVLPERERDLISGLLSNFSMNMTALNNYLHCPLEFYFNNLLRVPSGRSEASEFGSAVHHALEKFFAKRKEQNGEFPTKEVLLGDFRWYMNRNRENFSPQALERRLQYGQKVLSELHDARLAEWEAIKVYSVEQNFSQVEVDGIPLKGKLDLMVFQGNEVTIIDYKTGDPERGRKKTAPPTAREPQGSDYWRQAVFYKILAEAYRRKDYRVAQTVFQFVEPDTEEEYQSVSILPTPEDVQLVREQIRETWDKIQAHDFYTGCGKEECRWCRFAKEQKLYRDLLPAGEEDEAEEGG